MVVQQQRSKWIAVSAATSLSLGLFACGSEEKKEPTPQTSALYQRLGGAAGISAVIDDFVGRVVGDAKINGYFLNSTVNATRLGLCLKKQVGALTGGTETYPTGAAGADADGCRNMKTVHAGMGISKADFDDLAGHLVAALQAKGVSQADITTIAGALDPLKPELIEDADSDDTVYQRVGRKPAITAVVKDFVGKVAADASINGFFSATNINRLTTCLVSQVCSIDGPCRYGQEVVDEVKVNGDLVPCKDMKVTHASLVNGANPITKADFDAVVTHLVAALDGAGVPADDKDAILGVLGPLCPDIVKDGAGCN